jgi:hypothetical protein
MTASDRMTSERAEAVIEEIATTIRSFANDERGLVVVRVTYVRPSGDRCFTDYPAEEREGD